MSREEISVMRLVGAANRYIRGPFIVSGVLVGLFSSIITIILFWPISIWLGSQMTDFLGINLLSYYASNFFQLFFIILFIGVALGTISSFFAIHKYLRR
jgi:cell division transport system permease protein